MIGCYKLQFKYDFERWTLDFKIKDERGHWIGKNGLTLKILVLDQTALSESF